MSQKREQKRIIREIFTNGKEVIKQTWSKTRSRKEKTFTLTAEDLARGGLLTREEVATVIRQWLFDTYQGKLELEYYNDDTRTVSFSIGE